MANKGATTKHKNREEWNPVIEQTTVLILKHALGSSGLGYSCRPQPLSLLRAKMAASGWLGLLLFPPLMSSGFNSHPFQRNECIFFA